MISINNCLRQHICATIVYQILQLCIFCVAWWSWQTFFCWHSALQAMHWHSKSSVSSYLESHSSHSEHAADNVLQGEVPCPMCAGWERRMKVAQLSRSPDVVASADETSTANPPDLTWLDEL